MQLPTTRDDPAMFISSAMMHNTQKQHTEITTRAMTTLFRALNEFGTTQDAIPVFRTYVSASALTS